LTNSLQNADSIKNRLIKRSVMISSALCIVSVLFPIATFIGYWLEIPRLINAYPSLPAMQPNTACGLILGAITVYGIKIVDKYPWWKFLSNCMASVIGLLGILTLSQYIFHYNIGIDRIFKFSSMDLSNQFPGRPSPQTAFNFMLLGFALLIFNAKKESGLFAQSSVFLMLANAIVAATGYIFNTSEFYGFPKYSSAIGMAVHTAICFLFLGLSLLLRDPTKGVIRVTVSDTRAGSIARKVGVIAILAPPALGIFTHIGVILGLYEVSLQVALFTVLLIGILLQRTWQAVIRAEKEERRANLALRDILQTNENLKRVSDQRRIFECLVENSSDFIGIADPQGKPTYINSAGRRMVGLPADYPIDKTKIPDYYPDDQRKFVDTVMVNAMQEKGQWKGETFFRHWQTNQPIPVSDDHFLIRDQSSGDLLGMGTVTRDISDIKEAGRKIRDSQERLDLVLRGGNLGCWDWNIKTGDVVLNRRWAEMRGFKFEEVKQHVDSWLVGIHPDDRDRVDQALKRHFAGLTQEYEVEMRAKTKSGEWIWILDRGRVFEWDKDGQPLRMLGTELDITDRKRLEHELRLSEEKYSGIISVSADAIISVDDKYRIILFNEGAEKIFGYAKAEIIGLPLSVLIPERFRPQHDIQIERFSRGPTKARKMGERTSPIHGLRKDGKEFPADAAISRINVDGKIILTVSLRDVTAQKRAEDEQARLYEIARRAVQTREEVLAIVSHDLKNPLTAISLVSDLIRESDAITVDDLNQYSDNINRAVAQMKALTADLLDFSKMQSGTFAIKKSRGALKEVLASALKVLATQASAKKQKFIVEIPSDLPDIECDPSRIVQVVSNLAGNAIKFTPASGTIRIKAHFESNLVIVSVSDTGPGISGDEIEKIFDRFWQSKETRHLGSGLGLSIVKGLVEAHGGKIWVESTLGVGTKFSFTLQTFTETRKVLTNTPQRNISSNRNALEGVNVLVVDDAPDMLAVTVSALKFAGANVSGATTVSEALAKFESDTPDVLLTDIEMPEEDGFKLIERIKRLPKSMRSHIPIVAFTATHDDSQSRKLIEAGFDMKLTKPIDLERMIATIKGLAVKSSELH
jgi:PAS domain S-box-containing protein